MIWHAWWVWAVAGIGLGILEVVVPGFVFLGFAIGAVATGLLLLVGGAAVTGLPLAVLILIFACASLAAWLVVRRLFGTRAGQVKVWDRDINEN